MSPAAARKAGDSWAGLSAVHRRNKWTPHDSDLARSIYTGSALGMSEINQLEGTFVRT